MKLKNLINKLQDHASFIGDDVEVMVFSNGEPFDIENISHEIVGENEYPDEYNMPDGFEFISLNLEN